MNKFTDDKKYRDVEYSLFNYKKNLACLDILREDLKVLQASTDVKAQNYDNPFSENLMPSDPVVSRAVRIETVENKIKQLERNTKPITCLELDLSSNDVLKNSPNKDLLNILRFFYFANNPVDLVVIELNLSRTTFYERRRKLVFKALGYFCNLF